MYLPTCPQILHLTPCTWLWPHTSQIGSRSRLEASRMPLRQVPRSLRLRAECSRRPQVLGACWSCAFSNSAGSCKEPGCRTGPFSAMSSASAVKKPLPPAKLGDRQVWLRQQVASRRLRPRARGAKARLLLTSHARAGECGVQMYGRRIGLASGCQRAVGVG